MKVYAQAYHNLIPHMADVKTILHKNHDDFGNRLFFESGTDVSQLLKMALPVPAFEPEEFLQ